ncbi:MAG: transcriptional regulator NrdR [bacterium]|nr:transcriptional regulator NrdR [bacterium]
MYCPKCRSKETRVLDSRVSPDGVAIRRRRECVRKPCSFRFSTLEEIAILDLGILKRDGRRESYSREKLLGGLRKAFERRPITAEELRKLVAAIERDLQLLRKAEVRSTVIGDLILKHLRKVDEVAYVRFASVYESFDGLASFRKVLETLTNTRKKKRGRTRSVPSATAKRSGHTSTK